MKRTMLRHIRLLLLLCTTLGAQATFGQTSSPNDTLRYAVDAQQLRQHWDGWGVSLCWWATATAHLTTWGRAKG